jgi:hypothetical protein
MYRPHTEYRHRPYKANARSFEDVFFVCAQVYVIIFTLFSLTRWLSDQPAVQFHNIVIKGNHAVEVSAIEKLIREPMEGRLLWIWRKDNVMLYPTHTVKARIEALDQRIASVAVVSTRSQVLVTLSEYKPTFRYCLSRLGRKDGGILTVPTTALDNQVAASSTDSSTSTAEVMRVASSSPLSTSSALFFTAGELLSEGLLELPSPDNVAIDTHDCYWADDRGYLFAVAPQYSGSPLLTITESDSSRNASLGATSPIGTFIFEDAEFAHLRESIDELARANFSLRRIVRMQSGDVILDVGYPWNLAMNIKNDPKDALQHFFLGLKELGDAATGEKSQLKIIDVRFGNKVFYR